MAGEVSRQEQSLTRGALLVGEARQELDKQISDLSLELKDHCARWAGAGALAFKQLLNEWDGATKGVISELGSLQDNLLRAELGYRSADEASSAGITRTAASRLNL